jgi:hypothetical protein
MVSLSQEASMRASARIGIAEKSRLSYIWCASALTVDVSQEGERVMGWKGKMSLSKDEKYLGSFFEWVHAE